MPRGCGVDGLIRLLEEVPNALAHPEQHDQRVSLADGLLPQPPLALPQLLTYEIFPAAGDQCR